MFGTKSRKSYLDHIEFVNGRPTSGGNLNLPCRTAFPPSFCFAQLPVGLYSNDRN
jgi:hypothetical protein